MCDRAVEDYPDLMEQLLTQNVSGSESFWVERCLEGDGGACHRALYSGLELYEYPWEFDACFNMGDSYMCDRAVEDYPDLMEQLLTQSCYSWTNSEGLELSDEASISNLSAGTYSFNYNNGDCSYTQSFEIGISCSGCTDVDAFNYNENATIDDGNCVAVINGCVDAEAFNYNPDANTDDNSCIPVVTGCLDAAYLEFNAGANTDDGSCEILIVYGCMDATPNLMSNYNPDANVDDGSCVSWQDLANDLQAQLDNITPEDGIGQADVDAAYTAGIASVEVPECEEVVTQNIPLSLPQGWSMFGFTCREALNVIEAFSDISGKIEIVKDEWGLAYLPNWGFSAFDNLEFGEGYQIKMVEEVTDFQFCTTITGGASQEELDAAYTAGAASVTPEDGISQADVDAIQQLLNAATDALTDANQTCSGESITDPNHLNLIEQCLSGNGEACISANDFLLSNLPFYFQECFGYNNNGWDLHGSSPSAYACEQAVNSDGILISGAELMANFLGYTNYELDACGVINGDNSSCADECGVPNGDNSSCADECGVVNGDNSSCADCDGVPNGDNVSCADECGVINGDNSSCADDCGIPNGDNSSCVDDCGVPNGDNSSCTDGCGILNGDNSSCADECGVPNGDNSTCVDCAGVPNGTSVDLGCGCDEPAAVDGYDCDGNLLQIGDITAGGIIFEINEDGTGYVAALQDLGHMGWNNAMSAAANSTSQGYDDWYLPSKGVLQKMYNRIGPGSGNTGGFQTSGHGPIDVFGEYQNPPHYWSSSESCYEGECSMAWYVDFGWPDDSYYTGWKSHTKRVRIIRAF